MTNDLRQRVADAIEVADLKTKGPIGEGEFYLELADAAIAAMPGWMLIEEATSQDKDGGPVLGFCAPHVELMVYRNGKWVVANYPFACDLDPTHFMPLPLPPHPEGE